MREGNERPVLCSRVSEESLDDQPIARRPLAAPECGVVEDEKEMELHASPVCLIQKEKKKMNLPALEPLRSISAKPEVYCGPTDESNWAIPGRLLVGAFPGMNDDVENADLLTKILNQNVTTFVCLQKEYNAKASVNEWRSGHALRPYFASAVEICADLDPGRDLHFIQFGIQDCSVGEDSAVEAFARRLARRIRDTDQIVYLHCWGGHGRAGTITCLLFHLLYGLDDRSAMRRCQLVHDCRKIPIDVGSPQTRTQRDQVSRIIHKWSKVPRTPPPPPPPLSESTAVVTPPKRLLHSTQPQFIPEPIFFDFDESDDIETQQDPTFFVSAPKTPISKKQKPCKQRRAHNYKRKSLLYSGHL